MHPHSYKEMVVHLCRPNRTLYSVKGDPIKQVHAMPQAAQTHPECPGNPQCCAIESMQSETLQMEMMLFGSPRGYCLHVTSYFKIFVLE